MKKKGRGKGRNMRGGASIVVAEAIQNPEVSTLVKMAMIMGFILILVVIGLGIWAIAGYENYPDPKTEEKRIR